MTGNAGNHGNDGKIHKHDQTLNQTKENSKNKIFRRFRVFGNIEKTKNRLKDSRLKHPKKVCLLYGNISSVRNKLEALSEFVCTQVDFLAISETKLDSSVPTAQFNLPGFRTTYRKDITARSGGWRVTCICKWGYSIKNNIYP